jgi:sugar phosphate isomerase/epimerase
MSLLWYDLRAKRQPMKTETRRTFLARAACLGVAAGAIPMAVGTRAANDAGRKRMHPILLGGPAFAGTTDPVETARWHRERGYGAAYCPNLSLEDEALIRATTEAYRKARVVLAEVGRWVNLMEADADKRKAHLTYVTEGLALAEAVGARCCVDIAGSFSTDEWYGPHPENLSRTFFDAAVENARKIIDAVKPKRAKFCYEMMGWALPDSADSNLELLRAVDRPGFAVHLDPCNLVNSPRRFYENAALIDECFDKLGPWIVSCHAKDLRWNVEFNIHFVEVRPGTGKMDYRTYLRRLAQLPQQPPLMLEHLPNAEEYDLGRRHLLELGTEMGLTFG